MVKLAETRNLVKAKLRLPNGQEVFYVLPDSNEEVYRVSSIGDGNCGPYTFASAIIDLIQRDQLVLSEADFQLFYARLKASLPLLEERLKLYRGEPSLLVGNAYRDLVRPLASIMDTISENPNITFAQFKSFICSKTSRNDIAALQVALGPAIRSLASENFQTSLVQTPTARSPEIARDAAFFQYDGVEVGQEVLAPLAQNFFKINLHIYDLEQTNRLRKVNLTPYIPGAPSAAILHVPGHWEYLLPAQQRNGLACLPDVHQAAAVPVPETRANEVEDFYKTPYNPPVWESFWKSLEEKAEREQHNPDVQRNGVMYFFSSAKQIKVSRELQIRTDAELAKKLSAEEQARVRK